MFDDDPKINGETNGEETPVADETGDKPEGEAEAETGEGEEKDE